MQYSTSDVQNLIEDGLIGVYDTGERYADRYTVWLDEDYFPVADWYVYGFTMSEHPNHPQGCNMTIDVPFTPDGECLPLEAIPADVIKAIADRLSDPVDEYDPSSEGDLRRAERGEIDTGNLTQLYSPPADWGYYGKFGCPD